MWISCISLVLSGWIMLALPVLAMPARPDSSPITPGSQLTLKDAVAIALKFHPRHREAVAQSGAAGERVGEAQAALLPQVYSTGQYLRSTANGIGNTQFYDLNGMFPRESGSNHELPSNDTSQMADTYNNYLGGVSLSQFLLDFGRRRGYVTQRRYEAAAAKAQEDLVDLDLIFEVSQRYFSLLAAHQMVRVYEKAVEQRQYHLHEAQVKANAACGPSSTCMSCRRNWSVHNCAW